MADRTFSLDDWEGRKRALQPVLAEAARAGVIAEAQTAPLADFLLHRGVGVTAAVAPANGDVRHTLDEPVAADRATEDEESESPRFIRGYHDILITIGILITLAGLAGLTPYYVILAAVLVLSEVFVRRQRLALPAVVLTLAFTVSAFYAVSSLYVSMTGTPDLFGAASEKSDALIILVCEALLLGGYYWRYRVPIAFAMLCVSAVAFIVSAIAAPFLGPLPLETAAGRGIGPIFIGLFGLILFVIALYFDLSDPKRLTRRSDVAFWLHLVAAPALLNAVFVTTMNRSGGVGIANLPLSASLTLIAAVVVLMLAGVLLDRRAFVTSGLLSLGYAVAGILETGARGGLWGRISDQFSVVVLVVGAIVLIIGFGWRTLRFGLLRILPERMRAILPTLR